jgi:hypothetical protein
MIRPGNVMRPAVACTPGSGSRTLAAISDTDDDVAGATAAPGAHHGEPGEPAVAEARRDRAYFGAMPSRGG